MARGRKKGSWEGGREGREKSGGTERLAREPDNEICIFMHGCRPKFRGGAGFQAAGCRFSGTRRKTTVILNSLDDSEVVHPSGGRKGQRVGAAIYRRFPARTPSFFVIIFLVLFLSVEDQSVHGAKFLNGAARVMGLKFARDYPCKLKKISICTRKSRGNESTPRGARLRVCAYRQRVICRQSTK